MGASFTCDGQPHARDEERYQPGDVIGTKYCLLRKAGEATAQAPASIGRPRKA